MRKIQFKSANTLPIMAFITMIVVWSTTPLMLLWSTYAFAPELAAALRMAIGSVVVVVLLLLMRLKLEVNVAALKAYAVGALGVFGGMYCSYLAAIQIPTGLLAVCFGFSPIISGAFSRLILGETVLTPVKVMGLCLSVLGLLIIFIAQDSRDVVPLSGLMLALFGVVLFALSVVLGKKMQTHLHSMQTLAGSLLVATVCFVLVWLFTGRVMPDMDSAQLNHSLVAILYLGIFGSALGFLAFFYMIKKASPTVTALPTVITPVISLCIGYFFNHERLSFLIVVASLVIVVGLVIFVMADLSKKSHG